MARFNIDDFFGGLTSGLKSRRTSKASQKQALQTSLLGRKDIVPDIGEDFKIGGIPLRRLTLAQQAILKSAEDPLIGVKRQKALAEIAKIKEGIRTSKLEAERIGKGKSLSVAEQLGIGEQLAGLDLDASTTQEILDIINASPAAGQVLTRDIVGTAVDSPIEGAALAGPAGLTKSLQGFLRRGELDLPILGESNEVIRELIERTSSTSKPTAKEPSTDISNLLKQLDALEAALAE